MMSARTVLLTTLAVFLSGSFLVAAGQEAAATGPPRTKEQWLNELEVRQAQLALDQARQELERARIEYEETQQLYNERLVTISALNRALQAFEEAKLRYERARIELERTRLEFLQDATFVTVVDATKFRGKDGAVVAAITLRNDSDLTKARAVMGGDGIMGEDSLRALLKIDNIVVTLREPGGAIVGDPFQHLVPELALGQQVALSFNLLKREIEEVDVNVEFLGTKKQYNVFLKKEAEEDLPTLTASPYTQFGDLGARVTYDLDLERLARTEQSFALLVLNMPAEIPFAFVDAANRRVFQVAFNERLTRQSLKLEVSVPQKVDPSLLDAKVEFTVLITRLQDQKEVHTLLERHKGRRIPAEELATLKGNRADLVLTPRGVPKVETLVANLFKEVRLGDPIDFKYSVMNSGTLPLRRVTPLVDPALEWEATIEPREIALLEPGDKALVTVALVPPDDVVVGEYVMRIRAVGHSGIETVEAAEKDFTVRIAPKSNITGTIVLVAVLVVLVLGIAIASIKISRR